MASKAAPADPQRDLTEQSLDHTTGGQITRRRFVRQTGLLGASALGLGVVAPTASAWSGYGGRRARGPLRVSRANPRYLADPNGTIVHLAGAGTWGNVQNGFTSTAFDYGWGAPFEERAFLDMMSAHDLNYIRLWLYETPQVTYFGGEQGQPDDHPSPVPWRRTGPGTALDGKPKFDLTKVDPAYLRLWRSRITAAASRGIYVSVMLFEGFSVLSPQQAEDLAGWTGHPFNAANNINGIDGDPDATGQGIATHTLQVPAITKLQDMYVRTLLDAFNDLDNIMSYEIANESFGTAEWQYHMVNTIQTHEARQPKHHLAYMSFVHSDTTQNQVLFESAAPLVGHRWLRNQRRQSAALRRKQGSRQRDGPYRSYLHRSPARRPSRESVGVEGIHASEHREPRGLRSKSAGLRRRCAGDGRYAAAFRADRPRRADPAKRPRVDRLLPGRSA